MSTNTEVLLSEPGMSRSLVTPPIGLKKEVRHEHSLPQKKGGGAREEAYGLAIVVCRFRYTDNALYGRFWSNMYVLMVECTVFSSTIFDIVV